MVETDSGPSGPSVIPTVTFGSLTFSDGKTIVLGPTDIVVLVGPNNAGKSVALRELARHVHPREAGQVITSAQLDTQGSTEDFLTYFYEHTRAVSQNHQRLRVGFEVAVQGDMVHELWPENLRPIWGFFCRSLMTADRLTGSNPVGAPGSYDDPSSHPIHMMVRDDRLEERMSGYFSQAFSRDLIVSRLPEQSLPLLVGERPSPLQSEDRLSHAYLERLRKQVLPLEGQGDGMKSFATTILHLLAPTTASILVLDEPEAFLHPPQARLLGRILATERPSHGQLFVATHSPDIIGGLLEGDPGNVRILRVQRHGDVNRVEELNKELLGRFMRDPLMKHSKAMSGLFHERVIVCEGDADCMFYAGILDLPSVHGGRLPDVLFAHAGGTGRMADLAMAFRAAGVPVDVIADMDVIGQEGTLRNLIRALGGKWGDVRAAAKDVASAVEGRHKPKTAEEILEELRKIIETADPSQEPEVLRRSVEDAVGKKSAWTAIKRAGEGAIPSGQPTLRYRKLREVCSSLGLWLVPAGEMESFCKGVGGHGPSWVQAVLEERSLAEDPELEEAREFVGEIWNR